MESLNALDALAASTDATKADKVAAETPPDPNAPPPPPSLEEQAEDAVNLFSGLIVSYAPETAEIWTPEAKKAAVTVLVPVMQKYGWSMFELPVELSAIMVLGPLLWRSFKIIAAKMKQAEKNKLSEPLQKPNVTMEAPEIPRSPQMALYPNP